MRQDIRSKVVFQVSLLKTSILLCSDGFFLQNKVTSPLPLNNVCLRSFCYQGIQLLPFKAEMLTVRESAKGIYGSSLYFSSSLKLQRENACLGFKRVVLSETHHF